MTGAEFVLDFEVIAEVAAGFPIDESRLGDLAAYVLRAEGACGHWTIALALVDDERLRELHQQFMDDDSPTDIMTFPYGNADEPASGGDLVISVAHLQERASEWGHSPSAELEFLLAHGALHLLGYRDSSDDARAAMLRRQRDLIAAWQIASRA